jgi:phage FluMu protein Com
VTVKFVRCPACGLPKAVLAFNKVSRLYFFCPRCQHVWDTPSKPHSTSYSRRMGEYVYDIVIHEIAQPATAARFYAKVVNMVRVAAGQTVPVDELQDAYGATADEAVTNLEAAVKEWVKEQTRSN